MSQNNQQNQPTKCRNCGACKNQGAKQLRLPTVEDAVRQLLAVTRAEFLAVEKEETMSKNQHSYRVNMITDRVDRESIEDLAAIQQLPAVEVQAADGDEAAKIATNRCAGTVHSVERIEEAA